MRKVVLLGAGKIGKMITSFLTTCGDYEVTVADSHQESLGEMSKSFKVKTVLCNVNNASELESLFNGKDAVVSALPFYLNCMISDLALKKGLSYFDLTEDVKTTKHIREISKKAKKGRVFMPQCGLAPGFIGILGHDMAKKFDELETLRMRVGALPLYPSNGMMYNLTWSTDGLINEYLNPCEAIFNGKTIDVMPLEDLEHFSLDGADYEAFNTSGGLGTLCETWSGKVKHLNYKSVRYKGHQYLMNFLLRDLRLGEAGERRDLLKRILEDSIPMTKQDVVLIFVTATGKINGKLEQITDARKIYHNKINGTHWGSIQITTAAGICAVMDLFFEKKLSVDTGFVRQEDVALNDLLHNRFGSYYIDIHNTHSIVREY